MNWNKAVILYKYTSRERPDKFRDGLLSILENSNHHELIKFLITIDTDDPTKDQYHKVIDEVLSNSRVLEYNVIEGSSKNKIHAVNRDLGETGRFDIIVCMSDDMRFIQKGYDDIIRNDFSIHIPNGDGCIHYPDQNHGVACMTLNITDRIYFNRFGYIYHPDYVSVECDLENQEVAQMLGRYAFIEKRIFNHLHPSFGNIPYDAQYRRTEDGAVHERDKETRQKRKANNYDLHKTESGWESRPPIRLTTKLMAEEVEVKINALDSILEKAEKSKKLKGKLDKKMAECQDLASEITALGLVKVEVSINEEVIK